MSRLKTATSALTAAVLVTGIGLAWAQTDQQTQPTEPMTAATPMPTSEQTPADPNALTAADSTTATQQAMTANDPTRTTPLVDNTTALPSDSTARRTTDSQYNSDNATINANRDMNVNTPATSSDMSSRGSSTYEPAPRADRN